MSRDHESLLRDEARIRPGPQFAAEIMRSVRAAASEPAPVRFPWRLAGVALGAGALAFAGAIAVALRALGDAGAARSAQRAVSADAPRALCALALTLFATWLLARLGRLLAER